MMLLISIVWDTFQSLGIPTILFEAGHIEVTMIEKKAGCSCSKHFVLH